MNMIIDPIKLSMGDGLIKYSTTDRNVAFQSVCNVYQKTYFFTYERHQAQPFCLQERLELMVNISK